MTLMTADIDLPEGRGTAHVVDCVMCCLRLLQNCRFEQVWNKTVRPSPKVGLQVHATSPPTTHHHPPDLLAT